MSPAVSLRPSFSPPAPWQRFSVAQLVGAPSSTGKMSVENFTGQLMSTVQGPVVPPAVPPLPPGLPVPVPPPTPPATREGSPYLGISSDAQPHPLARPT